MALIHLFKKCLHNLNSFCVIVLFSLVSCGNSAIKKDGLLYGEVVGELYHTQYWDSNDQWDLQKMYLILHYDDESIERVDANDANAHYTFFPATPDGLPLGETKIELISGYYVDYKGEQHEIKPRVFEGAYVIKNPNDIVTNDKPLVILRVVIEILILSLIPIFLVTVILNILKRKKAE